MRWSPFLCAVSGVMPLPHLIQASIDFMMWMPRSLTILVLMTLLPLASIIFERLHPSRLLRTCPRWSGLLVLGDEYSIITSGLSAVACFSPNLASALMSLSRLTQACGATTRLRKPLTTLKHATASQSRWSSSPIC